MPKFLLLPYDNPEAFAGLGPDEIQRIIERYYAWTDRLRTENRLLHSDKLRDGEGRVVNSEGGRMVVRDGPYTETKEVIGGYWVVQADSYDAAVRLVADCPHIEFGTLEIRQIEET